MHMQLWRQDEVNPTPPDATLPYPGYSPTFIYLLFI